MSNYINLSFYLTLRQRVATKKRCTVYGFLFLVELTQHLGVEPGQTSGKGVTVAWSYRTVLAPFPEVWPAPAQVVLQSQKQVEIRPPAYA